MTQTQTPQSSKSKPSTPSAASTSTATPPAAATPCGCGCGGGCDCGCQGRSHANGCCKLTCFERPSYFCGQLLSDTDLTLEETYFREKNKLYHRTLDGFGVVCGMRMACDCRCHGHITIGDGFAIDCCGNDLVICDPVSFDVIGELRKKKWLIEAPDDCCEKEEYKERERGCTFKRCYYIGVCYSEKAIDYVTPYSTECSPGPGPCQPTRIREGVRFEIYDTLPVRPNPLTEIEKRIERCFRIFREGQFARGLHTLAPCILEIVCDRQEPNIQESKEYRRCELQRRDAYSLFQELRALFLHQLRICPDQYNCDMERDVCKVCAPAREGERDGASALECFTKLFELIQRYVFSCILAEFAFLCPQPSETCCVLIGSVEVENGRLTRVINYPRWYLWSFANFFEVLIYTLANEAACGKEADELHPMERPEPRDPCNAGCCPEIEVDLCTFLNLFIAENRAPEYAALTSVKAIQAVQRSLVAGFDFVKPRGVAPAVFNQMSPENANALAERLHFSLKTAGQPPSETTDPFSALLSNLMHRGSDPMAVFQKDSKANLTGATRIMDAPTRNDTLADLEARIAALEKNAEAKRPRTTKGPEEQK
jgi:hypothetical protein